MYSYHFRPEQGVRYPGIIFSYGILYDYQENTYYKNPLETTIFRLEGKKRIPTYKLDLSQYEKLSGEDDAIIAIDKKTNTGTNLPNKAAEKKFSFFNVFEITHARGVEYAQGPVSYTHLDVYKRQLLGLAHHYQAAATLYNSFNVLHLKNRISMMNKKRSHGIGRTKYLIFIPLAAFLMLLSNIEAVARITGEIAAEAVAGLKEAT